MHLTFIVAVDERGGMGCNNGLLCHLPDEMKLFKQTTTGHIVVMGRMTYESIGKPLPNRLNVILSRQPGYEAEGCTVKHSIAECWEFIKEQQDKEVFVIGGASIFEQTFNRCDKIIISVINNIFSNADTFFPYFDKLFDESIKNGKWNKPKIIMEHGIDDRHEYSFKTYELIRSRSYKSNLSPLSQLELLGV